MSVEQDEAAQATLLLRAFLRQFPSGFPRQYYDFLNGGGEEPDWSTLYPREWRAAQNEALRLRLGSEEAERVLGPRLDAIRTHYNGDTILIGGPPCQAYSLVGRARNRGVAGYVPEKDHKHFLYREYISILRSLSPLAFVMENVKGLLSATVSGAGVLEQVLHDVGNIRGAGGYHLVALTPEKTPSGPFDGSPRPQDFVIRAENLGVPQARHRVIIVGIRRDVVDMIGGEFSRPLLSPRPAARSSLEDVLDGMPRLRSGLSQSEDSHTAWSQAIRDAARLLLATTVTMTRDDQRRFRGRLRQCQANADHLSEVLHQSASRPVQVGSSCPARLRSWITDQKLKALPNHSARRHMPSDLARYLFAAVYAETLGVSPKAGDYPPELAPDHDNWGSGKFADRFRVQLRGKPATTVTSHISKDGHYFIHPDPEQCRSLTVREAARLQTFPDNYFFKGNRTQQYTQVGNAVPPYLAVQIGTALFSVLEAHRRACGRRLSARRPVRRSLAAQSA